MLTHLDTVDQRRAAASRRGNMHGFGHLVEVGTLLECVPAVRINAVRTLHGVRDGERDDRLLASRQRAVGEHGLVPIEELRCQIGDAFADFPEPSQILSAVVVVGHSLSSNARLARSATELKSYF